MSQSAPRDHVDLATALALSRELEAQQERRRLDAEMNLPPVQPPRADSDLMPASGTEGERSRWSSFSYDRPGSDQPAETREAL